MRKLIRENNLFFGLFLFWLAGGALLQMIYHKGYWVLYFAFNRHPAVDRAFVWITMLGESSAYLIGFIWLLFVRIRYALLVPLVGLSAFLLSQSLKRFFGVPRPQVAFYKLLNSGEISFAKDLSVHVGHNSFPSGHTISAFAMFSILAFCISNKKIGVFFFIAAVAVGLSRVVLSQHFFQDIYFGSIFGLLIAVTLYLIQDKKALSGKWYDKSFAQLFLNKK